MKDLLLVLFTTHLHARPTMLRKLQVLLVEDDRKDAELIQQYLSADENILYEIEPAETLEAAMKSLRGHQPDLIMLDLNLPDAAGVTAVKRIYAAGFDLPIVVVTGYPDSRLELEALHAGVQDYVEKTIENYTLLPRILRFAVERHQMLTALQDSEQRYRMLSEISSDYMFAARVEPDGKIIQEWTTGALEEITGYTLDEYLSNGGWPSTVHPEDQSIDERDMETLNHNQPVNSQIRIIKKDGSIGWVQVKAFPIWDEEQDRLVGISGSTLDITDQKNYEQELRRSEFRFKTMFEEAPIGIGLTDAETFDYLNVNQHFAEMVGYSEEQLLAMTWVEITHPEDIDADKSFMEQLSAGEIDSFEMEKRYLHANGSSVWVNMKVTSIFVDEFGRRCMLSMAEDITEKKAVEFAQQKNLERLEILTSILHHPYNNLQEFLDFALEEAIQLTDSSLGYIFFYDEDLEQFDIYAWSQQAMAECAIEDPQLTYQLKNTGIWGEAVRQRKSIILNDFQAPHPLKKGLPQGHAPLFRFLTVPVFSDEKIVAVVGVANKKTDYDHHDELQLTLLMNNVWKVIERERVLQELAEVNQRMEHYVTSSDVILFAYDLTASVLESKWQSDIDLEFLGYTAEEVNQPDWWPNVILTEDFIALEEIAAWQSVEKTAIAQDYPLRHKNGSTVWINERIRVIGDEAGKPIEAIVAWTDVTARKQMETSAAESAARLETALSNMADPVYLTDAQGNITHFNQSTAEFFKFRTKEECSNHFDEWASFIEVMSTDGEPVLRENWSINRALRGETESNIEYMFRRKDTGETWYGRYNFAPIQDDNGKVIGSVVTGSDITEQKEMLQNIQQYAEDLNKAQSVAQVGSWKWNVRTDELTWSDEMYRIFGIDQENFTGYLPDVIANAIHPDDRAAVEASNRSVIEHNQPIPVEYRITQPDGSLRTVWAEAGELVTDEAGNPLVLSGIVQDITERKAAEEQLLLKDTALNAAANSIMIANIDWVLVWINPAFCAMTGFSEKEIVGKKPGELLRSGKQNEAFYRKLENTVLAGEVWRGELINRNKDGTLIDVHETITPIVDEHGEITHFVCILEDITTRKQQENQIQTHLRIQEKLVAMGRAFGALIDVQMIYRTAYRYIREIIEVPNMSITLIDPFDQELNRVFVVNDGIVMDTTQFGGIPYAPDNASAYRSTVIASQQPIITNQLEQKVKNGGTIFIGTTAMKPQSAIYVPMIAEGKSLGVIELQSYQKGAFTQETSEWLSVVANQVALAVQNARLYDQIRRRVSQLNGLREIDTAINGHRPLMSIFQLVLNQIRFHIKPDAADIVLINEKEGTFNYQAGYGFKHADPRARENHLKCPFAGKVIRTGKQVLQTELDGLHENGEVCEKYLAEKFASYAGLPIIHNDQVVGVLEVFHRSKWKPQLEWLQYLETLAGQVSIAVENNDLISNLQQTADDLVKAYDATIEGWSHAMDLRDRETEGHTQRVTHLTYLLAQAAGVSEEQWIQIRRGALLHDIGKLGVPDSILNKPGPLTPEEWEIMKQHPTYAYDMLKNVEYLQPALEIPHYHHEKWDGSGYPEGLAGEDIPLAARIFALVDVWDAVTNDRPYKEAWSKPEALALIKEGSGTHFDPELAKLFINIIDVMDS